MPKKWTTAQFISKAQEVHGEKYDYSSTVYVHMDGHVIIKCLSCDAAFSKMAKLHIQGIGCMTCHKKPRISKTQEKFIEQARQVHELKYDYSLVSYQGHRTLIIIVCCDHGEFTVTPDLHLNGQGCRECFLARKAEDFYKKAKAVHGELYDYSEADYSGGLNSVTIKCKKHGAFTQIASNHLRGNGCGLCADAVWSLSMRLSTAEFIEKSKQVWKNKYTYENTIYECARKELIVTCPDHGDFVTIARVHTMGCTSCSGCQNRGYSQKSIRWLRKEEETRNISIQHAENGGEFKIPTTPYHADGYHAESKTVWEYLGSFWHGNPDVYPADFYNKMCNCTMGDLYEKTMKRIQHIESLGFTVIVKWEEKDD